MYCIVVDEDVDIHNPQDVLGQWRLVADRIK